MELFDATGVLSALAHEGRLAAFRLLVRAGPEGRAAGEIAEALRCPASTLSTHLAVLAHAGLVAAERQGRSIRYTAHYARFTELLGFLIEDCCNGAPEICSPLAEIARRAEACA